MTTEQAKLLAQLRELEANGWEPTEQAAPAGSAKPSAEDLKVSEIMRKKSMPTADECKLLRGQIMDCLRGLGY